MKDTSAFDVNANVNASDTVPVIISGSNKAGHVTQDASTALNNGQ